MGTVSVVELMILLFMAGGPFNQVLGLPPGDRDANLVHAAPADSLMYLEWAQRGEGQPGAAGVDGLVCDPEIVAFFDSFKSAIKKSLARNTGVEGIETIKTLPEFVLAISGKPGCLYWRLDAEAVDDQPPGQITLTQAIRAGLVVNTGEDTDAMTDSILALIAATGIKLDALDHSPLPLPAPVQIHRHNNYIILAVGPNAVDDIIERLAAKAGGISKHPDFVDGWKDLGMDRSGLITFLNIESAVQKFGDLTGMREMAEQGLQIAGIDGIKSMMSVTGVADGQIISRSHVKGITGDQGLMSLFSGRGIKPEDFALVPDDSDVVFAFSADARIILDAFIAYAGAMDPNAAEEISAGYEQFGDYLGIDFQNDVFSSLDHVITVSNSKGDGGWIGSSPVLTIGIKNPRSAAKTAIKIAEAIERESNQVEPGRILRRGMTLERRDFLGTEITMVNFIGEDEIVVAPAWCLTKTHVMIALHPQALKSRLRRLNSGEWKSFAEKFQGGPGGETVAYSAIDVPRVLPQLYGFLPWLGQLTFGELQASNFDMNLMDFPSAAAVLPYMTESRSYVVRTPDGISKFSSGPPIVGSVPSLMPLLLMSTIRFQTVQVDFEDAAAVEALEAEIELRAE